MKNWLVAGVAIALAVVVGVWVNSGRKANEKKVIEEVQSPVVEGTPAPQVSKAIAAVKEFTVVGTPFKFVPAEIRVKVGDTVKVTFKNEAGTHNFTIDQFEIETKTLNAGEQDAVQFVVDQAGTYEYYCSVDAHKDKGMTGKLIVE